MNGDQPVLRMEQIAKTFRQADQDVHVLKGIDLTVLPGEFIALQGSSGSGKSTLMHIIGLLERASSGRYFLEGRDVSVLSDDELSGIRNQKMGFIFQAFYLVPYVSALENVMLPGLYSQTPARELRQEAKEILSRVGLADRMHFKPGQLSGGQQQRVAIARALVNDPQVLLADEPTGQLDANTSLEILKLITQIHEQGRTVILVTHDSETAAYAQRKILLNDGRIETA
jgi:putative ABC transport system ATP-binding protein